MARNLAARGFLLLKLLDSGVILRSWLVHLIISAFHLDLRRSEPFGKIILGPVPRKNSSTLVIPKKYASGIRMVELFVLDARPDEKSRKSSLHQHLFCPKAVESYWRKHVENAVS